MSSRSLAALLVAGCTTAAAGGAYLAVRQNAASQPAVAVPVAAAPVPAASPQPVSETEALVGRTPASSGPADRGPADRGPADRGPAARRRRPSRRRPHQSPLRRRSSNGPTRFGPARRRALNRFPKRERRPAVAPLPADRGPGRASQSIAAPRAGQPGAADSSAAAYGSSGRHAAVEPVPEPVRAPEPPPAPPQPQFEEVVLPASSVVGLQVDTPLSSERARIEDRVDARVTRDVTSSGASPFLRAHA